MLTVQDHRALAETARLQTPARGVDALRSLVASRFAQLVGKAVPDVRARLLAQLGKSPKFSDKELLRRATRALSLHQADLVETVENRISQRFDDKLHCPEDAISHTGRFSADAMKLFAQLGMEEEFEMELCVGRLREHCQAEMPRLVVALRDLLERQTLPESHNPLFPRVFLRSLLDGLHDFDCDATTCLAIFRAFCAVLPPTFTDVYAQSLKCLYGNSAEVAHPIKTA
jgi:hypothetical protein